MPAGSTVDEKAFDSEAFKTSILADIDTKLNGFSKTLKIDVEKILTSKGGDQKKDDDTLNPDGTPKVVTPPVAEPKTISELNARLNALTSDLTKTRTELDGERKLRSDSQAAQLELERVKAFDDIINGQEFQFATPKAKQQFRAAYINNLIRDETGNLVIKGPNDTPMEPATFLKTEYTESTHLQPYTGRGGAGTTRGTNGTTTVAKHFNYRDDMTPSEIAALSPEAKAEYRSQVAEAVLQSSLG